MKCFDGSRSTRPSGAPLAVLLVLLLASLAACHRSGPTTANGIPVPGAADAQAAARTLVERILADYIAAGETDPIGFLARRDDVDSTVISTLQHSMSLDPRDPLHCDAKSARDYHFEKIAAISPARWTVGMITAASNRDSFTVEFGADGKWRLVSIDCP